MRLGAEQLGENAARREADLVPLGEDDFQIGMEFAVRQPRRAMIEAPRQLADFGMQRAAERDIHLLKAAADAEQRHAARDAGLDQRQRERIAAVVVRLAARMLFVPEVTGMDVGARAGEQNAVDGIEEDADIGDLRRAGKHQRHGARGLGDRAQIAVRHALRGELAFHQMRAADHADDWLFAAHFAASALRFTIALGISLAGRGEKIVMGRADPAILV